MGIFQHKNKALGIMPGAFIIGRKVSIAMITSYHRNYEWSGAIAMDWAKGDNMNRYKIPMKLQIFAEDGEENKPVENKPEEQPKVLTLDEFLKQDGMQAEFDRRISKAIETAKAKWDKAKDESMSEAERLKNMSDEQKREYNYNKRLKALEDREAAANRKELLSEAKNTLADKHIPSELATLLDLSSAENCNKSIETLEKAFNDAVTKAVAEKLKGSVPPKKAPKDPQPKKFSEMTYAERLELKTKNPEEYKRLSGK